LNPGILKLYKMKKILILLLLCTGLTGFPVWAQTAYDLGFSFHKLESGKEGNTILVIGGIQGDEPGGFNAASLIVTHYRILSGNVWVVPNLNFVSIVKRSRGVYGDLNRKFDQIKLDDPEFDTITRIKNLISDSRVDMVLNLHDGSGFYRKTYIDKMHNSKRWGQCIIIDQDRIQSPKFSNLNKMAETAVSHVNQSLLGKNEMFNLNNTETGKGNEDMAKTLTYYTIKNNKPAFGIEASKSFPTSKRAYYHLLAIESFFKQAGIEYERRFELSQASVKASIDDGIQVTLNDSRIRLTVENVRNYLSYIPMEKNGELKFKVNNPLLAVINSGKIYKVYHGNRHLTHLDPQYFDYDLSINSIHINVDGKDHNVTFGDIVRVQDQFRVTKTDTHRINIIGFKKKHLKNECGVNVRKRDFQKRFSIDNAGNIFRVEVYKGTKFSGMVLVDFGIKKNNGIKVAMDETRLNEAAYPYSSDNNMTTTKNGR